MDNFPGRGWGLGAEEEVSAVVKGGGGSEGWLPGDRCPEHAYKLSRKDWDRRGGGGECNKEADGLCSMWILSETRHPLCVFIRAGDDGVGELQGPDWQETN